MTPARTRTSTKSCRGIPHTLALAVSLALPLLAGAQESTQADTSNSSEDCTSREDCAPEPELRTYTLDEFQASSALDWVSLRELPKAMHNSECESCRGGYLDPLADANTSAPPEAQDINATATSSEVEGDEVYLHGGVSVQQGYRQLSGEEAQYNRTTGNGTLKGNIVFREPGILLRGEQANFSAETGEAEIINSEFVLHQQHMRGEANVLRRDSDGLIHVDNGGLTYCAPGDSDWLISADSMELDLEEGVGTARGARIRVADIPVFYLPWMRLPLDDRRRTGLLWPDIGSDSQGGLDLAVPIYLNLAPNYDALYTPRYIGDRGFNHEVELRYLSPTIGRWTVGGAYMAEDDLYKDEHPELDDHKRWLGQIQHSGLFEKRWRSRVDYSKASDVDYLKDLQTTNLETRRETSLLQLASLDYLGDRWLASVDFQRYQSLADDIRDDYKKLPQITGQYRPNNTPFEVTPILLGQYSYFDTDEERVKGQRFYSEAGASYPMNWQSGFLKPTLKYRYLEYDLTDLEEGYEEESPSTGSALFSLDGGLYFDRQTHFGDRGLVQTLEPRLYYLYSEFEDQSDQPDFDSAELTFSYNQLFRETRFSGRDRLDDANQLSMGLTTRYISDEDGREHLNASIGQIFYFRDRKVRLLAEDDPIDQSGSEMAAEVNFYPNERLTLRSSMVWDPYNSKMNAGHVQAGYESNNGAILNAGYSYRRPLTATESQIVTEQAHFSAYYPLANRWTLFGAINYSIEANTSIEDMIGVEYDTCCWQARLLYLRYYDTNTGLNTDYSDPNLEREYSMQVQIILKGMGGFGSRVTGLLEDMIRGFKEREY